MVLMHEKGEHKAKLGRNFGPVAKRPGVLNHNHNDFTNQRFLREAR
jgi:hypothetical protein